jgi:hypothetical protein
MFAFRYFEVAEMFGRREEDKTQEMHEKRRKITSRISYVGIIIIAINYMTAIINRGILNKISGEWNVSL